MKFSKSMIASYVGLAFLVYSTLTGHKVAPELVNSATDWIFTGVGFGLSVYGIWKNHRKPKVDKPVAPVVK